jgi:hypothetical protein
VPTTRSFVRLVLSGEPLAVSWPVLRSSPRLVHVCAAPTCGE